MAFCFLRCAVTNSRASSSFVMHNSRLRGHPPLSLWLIPRTLSSYVKEDTILQPWPQPWVDCHGDYRQEAFLEKGKMYQNQETLPRLPIPSLEETMTRFLPTALPLAETPEEEETLVQACRDFSTQARELQERLLRHDASLWNSSWLQQWWNTEAYLNYRDPVVIYVSYFFQLDDDDTLLQDADRNRAVKRAASALRTAAEFRNRVASGTMEPDTIGRQEIPLCMTPYKYMFHACRIPHLKQDSYKIYDPSRYKHAIVACQGHFYKISLFHEETGQPLPIRVLERALEQCATKAETTTAPPVELGYLTTSNRDDWARARTELLQLGGTAMEDALEELESGALLVCLDIDAVPPKNYQEGAEHYWYSKNAANRWFDKSIQLVCTANGKMGYIGEHSMMDGMPAVHLCQEMKRNTYQDHHAKQEEHLSSSPATIGVLQVKDIFEDVWADMSDSNKERIQELIDQAKSDFETLVSHHEVTMLDFEGYGSNFIKRAGFPPDAYVQMAMQLATYRLFGKQVATYESVQVRPFLHGRTETARSVSPASHAFCQHMGLVPNVQGDRREKRALLRAAAETHREYCRDASKGWGVDRHLFGLSMLLKEDEAAPALLGHPLYDRSKHWRVTSSTVGISVGFGEVVPDGVGIGYLVRPDSCNFTLTCRREHAWTKRLGELLEEALEELRTVAAAADPDEALPN